MAKPGSTQIGNKLITTIPTFLKFGQAHPIQEAARFEIECIVPPIDDFATEILADVDVPDNCRVHISDVTVKRCSAFTGMTGPAWAETGTTTLDIQSNDGFMTFCTLPEAGLTGSTIIDLSSAVMGEGMSYDGGGPIMDVVNVVDTTTFYASRTDGLAAGDLVWLYGSGVTSTRTISSIAADGLITLSGTHGMTVGSYPNGGTYKAFIFKRPTVSATANSASQTLSSIAGLEVGDVLFNLTEAAAEQAGTLADTYTQVTAINPSTRVVTCSAAVNWTAADPLWVIKPYSHGGMPGKGLRAKVANNTSFQSGSPLIINVRGLFVPNEWHTKAMSNYVSAINAGGGIWAAPA